MHTYPLLTPLEQDNLPVLIAVPSLLPSKFADSTHQVFLCETVDGPMVLKVCDEGSVTQSGFWQGLNHLFLADFPNSLAQIGRIHDLLAKQGCFAIPEYVASSRGRFVLSRFLSGEDVDAARITDVMVMQLAKHVGKLHQLRQSTWGNLHAPVYEARDWPKRLHATLLALAAQSGVTIRKSFLQDVLTQANAIEESEFTPMMLDLRWDQFRTVAQSNALALIDLDAFVIGPRSLELVLLEYVLTPQQFALFKSIYTEKNDWPDYSAQKASYQLLLFLMQVLGETDLASWMKRI
jgi:hypothetical protein